jgi:hypothetical protein
MRSGDTLPLLAALGAGLCLVALLASAVASVVLLRRLKRQLHVRYPELWAEICATGGGFFDVTPKPMQIIKRMRTETLDPGVHRIAMWYDRLLWVQMVAALGLVALSYTLKHMSNERI